MPIEFPLLDRGPDWDWPNQLAQSELDFDITNLGCVGAEFDLNMLNPGLPIDFNNAGVAVNLYNLVQAFEAPGFQVGCLPNPVPAPVTDNAFSVLQYGTSNLFLSGVSRDSTGATLGSCQVLIFRTEDKSLVAETVSDASGNWSVTMNKGGPFFLVEYKAGSPDVAGTSVNTLVPA